MKNFKGKQATIFTLIILLLTGCYQNEKVTFSGKGLGSYYTVTYIGKENKKLPIQIDSMIQEFVKTFSFFDTNSMLSKINSNISMEVNDDFVHLFNESKRIYQLTNGFFDPTVAPLVTMWGFGREQKKEISQQEIDSIKQLVGYEKINLQNKHIQKDNFRIQLNFNAIAEGYIVDKLVDFLEKEGYPNCLLYLGGEIKARGTKYGSDWQVGILLPASDGKTNVDYIFPLKNRAVSTSGNYRKYRMEDGQRISHIINPKTGLSEKSNLLSVTVLADNCIDADALATAFMVMGMKNALKFLESHPQYAAYFIYEENQVLKHKKTTNFP